MILCQHVDCNQAAAWCPIIRFWGNRQKDHPAVECPLELYLCTDHIKEAHLQDLAGPEFWRIATETMRSFHKMDPCRSTAELSSWPAEKTEEFFKRAKGGPHGG